MVKTVSVALIFSFLLIFGCSGGSGGSDQETPESSASSACTFKISDVSNGPDADNATSQWECDFSNNSSGWVRIYGDGTGNSENLGDLTWKEVGCSAIDFTTSKGLAHVTKLTGSIESNVGTFTQSGPGSTYLTASCTLKTVDTNGSRLLYGKFDESYVLSTCFGSSYLASQECSSANDPFNGTAYLYFTKAYHDLDNNYQVVSGSKIEIENMAGTLLYSVADEGTVSGGRRYTITHNDQNCVCVVQNFPSASTSKIAITCTKGSDTCYKCYE